MNLKIEQRKLIQNDGERQRGARHAACKVGFRRSGGGSIRGRLQIPAELTSGTRVALAPMHSVTLHHGRRLLEQALTVS